MVPMALFSDIPQPSLILMPNRLYQRKVATEIGAAPDPQIKVLFNPSSLRIFLATRQPINGVFNKKSSLFCGILASTPIRKRIHKRGTDKNIVGCTALTS